MSFIVASDPKDKKVGLQSSNQIQTLLDKLYKMPKYLIVTETNLSAHESPKGINCCALRNHAYRNFKIKNEKDQELFVTSVRVPSGFPLVVMFYGNFADCPNIRHLLKISRNRERFKKILKTLLKGFIKNTKKNDKTEAIVLELKQTTAILNFLVSHIEHLFMEYIRGAIATIFTGRPRKI